ncbi:MAG: hypothetical protein IPK74_39750 [Deltaproteobacteria bacterium]|nr:hypothetical protein [Deltaproteobacteria bacterium]
MISSDALGIHGGWWTISGIVAGGPDWSTHSNAARWASSKVIAARRKGTSSTRRST